MATYIHTGDIITSAIEILLLVIRRKVFRIKHFRHFASQTLGLQLASTVAMWLSLAAIHHTVYREGRFLNSMYYSMVSISTVGFGDFPFITEDFYEAGIVYWICCLVIFVFSLGMFTASIGQVNKIFIKTSTGKMKIRFLKKKMNKKKGENRTVGLNKQHQLKEINNYNNYNNNKNYNNNYNDINNNNNNNSTCNCNCHRHPPTEDGNMKSNKYEDDNRAYYNHLF